MRTNSISTQDTFEILVDELGDNVRLDSFLSDKFTNFSRAKIQRAINKGHALVDGLARKSSFKLNHGQVVHFQVPPTESESPIPEDIPLDIVYEDNALIGINKPPAMVVHPAKGHWSGTLTAALAFHFEQLSAVGGPSRPGIVHRLDRDTSGIIIVAKTDEVHRLLSQQFERREVKKTYVAIVTPPPDRDQDIIDQPIGVHPYQREKMAIRSDHKTSRDAVSRYEVAKRAGRFALVYVMPKTGRTHQIRVHMNHLGSAVVADKLYSGNSRLLKSHVDRKESDEVLLSRQALHAKQIEFKHPLHGANMLLKAELSQDLSECWKFIESKS